MRKRTSPTILERAIAVVPEFKKVIEKLSQQLTLRGLSKSPMSDDTPRKCKWKNISKVEFLRRFCQMFPDPC